MRLMKIKCQPLPSAGQIQFEHPRNSFEIIFRFLVAMALIMAVNASGKAEGINFSQAANNSLFSDHQARRIGDLLTVMVMENAEATHSAKTVTKKNHKTEASGGPGSGALGLLPEFGFKGEGKNEFDGQGSTVKSGSLKATMTVTVVGLKENGNLLIEGNRVIGVNDDKETLILKGEIRTQDIMENNTVYSYNIANAEISYKGKGVANTGAKPGIIARFLNWIF
ncbi:MAG: flagellar biosynthesis protein FlgH [candidate division Zixibacteria bacterium CG_4_9_14_3_um_filter_46_8]|nr:MAG: flagellar biosynthesis protein FlgH [candidate division Zixibacteria bacterium CG_4_9_14_3_um_filter_46_8]